MIPVDEYYSFPEDEQANLVRKGHVVVDGEIASSIPDSQRNVHVFDNPVEDEIIRTLQRGHYTVEELVEEFPLEKRFIKSFVFDLRHRPQHLLGNYQSVMRVTNTEGAAYVYTVEPLPYEVRVWDPTLCWHLLGHGDSVQIPEFPSDKMSWTSAREEFVEETGRYWGLPESDLPQKSYQGISFANSALGPLPKSIHQDEPEVRERVRDVDGAYRRRRFDEENIKHSISYFKSLCRRNPSLAAFQSFTLYLYDLSEFIILEGHPEYRPLLQGGTKLFFACLFGGYRVRHATDWKLFEVERVNDLSQIDGRITDVVELQPTSNSELSERWGLPESSAVQRIISGELDQYATRNSDNYICATESACRYMKRLENEGIVNLSKKPPEVPNQARTVFK
ncbi:hypothetical protein GCM10028857_03040 [Salinarchaeum chitinilyticum]